MGENWYEIKKEDIHKDYLENPVLKDLENVENGIPIGYVLEEYLEQFSMRLNYSIPYPKKRSTITPNLKYKVKSKKNRTIAEFKNEGLAGICLKNLAGKSGKIVTRK